MSGIVCPIRGGPSSQSTIERAVTLAISETLPLCFLYVVNLDFLIRTESSRVRTISKEMEEMGEFILLNAQAKAEEKGVDVEGVVRNGNVGEEIITLAKDLNADYVVLGQPRGEEGSDVFTHDRLTQFGERIEEESGAKIIMVGAGEV